VSALAGFTPQMAEAIIAHELAHVRRHDYLLNMVQTAIETLLFYHPAVWWVEENPPGKRKLLR
jgi:D-alanyl-D-alanine endopeptidase (penicillin-binding protein 7)